MIELVQISDAHWLADPQATLHGVPTRATLAAIVNAIRHRYPTVDALLFSGDLANDSEPEVYTALETLLETLGPPIYALPGNHDALQVMYDTLPEEAICLERSVMMGGWHLVLLNSVIIQQTQGELVERELQALEEALSQYPDRHTLVALHHQPVCINTPWMDRLGLKNSDDLFRILDRHAQVRAVLFGHIHQAFEGQRGPVRLLGCPAASFQFVPGTPDLVFAPDPPAYRWLRMEQDGTIHTRVESVEMPDFPMPRRM